MRHPEHANFLEESWLYEAITETYLPLIEMLEGWIAESLRARITVTLSPTLSAMLADSLLRERYEARLAALVEFAHRETFRCRFEPEYLKLAEFYHERLRRMQALYRRWKGNVLAAFRHCEEAGVLELGTCGATHALLPLCAPHPPSVRAQVLAARDSHQECFGQPPRGIWLPECGYAEGIDLYLRAAGIQWFVVDTHGLMLADPQPRYATFAPLLTPAGVAVFGRDLESAKQVWSRHGGYPGDGRYRDFYRDAGFDLDLEHVRGVLPAPGQRGFTGIKYHRITDSSGGEKKPYDRGEALIAAAQHAAHFVEARGLQLRRAYELMGSEPVVICPYDAELFGHWWFEGIEFLDGVARELHGRRTELRLATPGGYLAEHRTHQMGTPSPSTWGEEGYHRAWLNENNAWVLPRLRVAQERMTELARRHANGSEITRRALRQAARELMLAQASDWTFLMRQGGSPDYSRKRVLDHLAQFDRLARELSRLEIDEPWLARLEAADNLFPTLDVSYWE